MNREDRGARGGGSPLRAGLRLALLVVPAALALAGSPRGGQTPSFSGSTDVLSVEIPIQVTVAGEPARGLQAGDFEVYEGRKRLKVSGFEAVDFGSPGSAEGASRAIPAAARRHFLFLFDLTFAEPKSVYRARVAARDLLPTLHPSDLVAVATYRATVGPQLVLGFTSDRSQVETALETLGFPELLDRTRDPLRLAVGAIKHDLRGPGTGPGMREASIAPAFEREILDALQGVQVESIRTDRALAQGRVSAFASTLATFARLLGEVEGRKYVILMSEGFDASLIAGTTDSSAIGDLQQMVLEGQTWRVDSDSRFGLTEAGNEVERMLEELRRADCVVQSVDIGGLRGQGEEGVPALGDRDSLFLLARGTGGELYESFNDLGAALKRLNARTGVTYLLSVEPEKLAADGAYHRLRVELKTPVRGAVISARQGFYAPRPYAERDPLERLLQTANLVMSGEESREIDLSVLALPANGGGAGDAAGGKSHVSLLIEVDGATLLRGNQPSNLPIEIYAYALDGSGAVHDFLTETLRFDLGKGEPVLRSGGLKFAGHLELLPGEFSLRVLVRNGATGLYGLRAVPVRVPSFAPPVATLLPPLFPDPRNRWLLAREEPRGEMRETPLPYTPAARPELAAGAPVRFVVAGYGLGRGPWRGEADLLGADGAKAGSGRLQLASPVVGEGGADRAAATLTLPELPAGSYDLRLTLTPGAGSRLVSVIPILLRGRAPGGPPP